MPHNNSFHLNGKKIVIKNLPNDDRAKLIENDIIDVCANEFYRKFYPKLTFIIFDDANDPRNGYVIPNEMFIIHLNSAHFNAINRSDFQATILHELVHCFQISINEELVYVQSAHARLRQKLAFWYQKNEGKSMTPDFMLKKLKVIFSDIMDIYFYEGLAYFMQLCATNPQYLENFTHNTFALVQISYNSGLREAQSFIRNWNIIQEYFNKFQPNFVVSLMYSHSNSSNSFVNQITEKGMILGISMVQVVFLNLKSSDLNDLIKMSPLKFLKHYELSTLKMHQVPLVTLNSGRGIIDYKRMLNQLTLIHDQYKKYGKLNLESKDWK